MAALKTGTSAPDFTLPTMDGKHFSLREALARRPVLAAFFKISCPTCQYAFPFLQRIYEDTRKNADHRRHLAKRKEGNCDIHEAIWADLSRCFWTIPAPTCSNAYGLTNVPTIFWIARDGEIEVSSVGWVRKDVEEINQRAAGLAVSVQAGFSVRTNRSPISAPVEGRKTSPRSRAKNGRRAVRPRTSGSDPQTLANVILSSRQDNKYRGVPRSRVTEVMRYARPSKSDSFQGLGRVRVPRPMRHSPGTIQSSHFTFTARGASEHAQEPDRLSLVLLVFLSLAYGLGPGSIRAADCSCLHSISRLLPWPRFRKSTLSASAHM